MALLPFLKGLSQTFTGSFALTAFFVLAIIKKLGTYLGTYPVPIKAHHCYLTTAKIPLFYGIKKHIKLKYLK